MPVNDDYNGIRQLPPVTLTGSWIDESSAIRPIDWNQIAPERSQRLSRYMDVIRSEFFATNPHLLVQSIAEESMSTDTTEATAPETCELTNRYGDPVAGYAARKPELVAKINALIGMDKPETQRRPFTVFQLCDSYGTSARMYMYRKSDGTFYRFAASWYRTAATVDEILDNYVGSYFCETDAKRINVLGAKELEVSSIGMLGKVRDLILHNRDMNTYVIYNRVQAMETSLRQRPLLLIGPDQRYDSGRAFYKGSAMNSWTYNKRREQFAAVANIIRQAVQNTGVSEDDELADELVELLNDMRTTCSASLNNIVEVFNLNSTEGVTLADCGHYVRDTLFEYVGDDTCCTECYEDDDLVVHCVYDNFGDDVGPRWRDDVYYWDRDGDYHTHAEPEDEDEDEDEDHSLLASWGASTGILNHDRTFKSSSQGEFIMGVELEVETKEYGERYNHLHKCNDFFNSQHVGKYAMFKRDGSLNDDRGFEIVTAARKLDDHLAIFGGWEPGPGLVAWNAGNCGMHVHIDSRAFSALTLGKFVTFINSDTNEAMIKRIAGRHPNSDSNAQSYCAKVGQDNLDLPSKALKAGHHSRYRMVNMTNLTYEERKRLHVETERECKGSYSTVELRIFRASLKKERLLAQLEFTHAAVMFCRTASYSALTEKDFKNWLAVSGQRYKSLCKWFGVTVVNANKTKAAVPELAEV